MGPMDTNTENQMIYGAMERHDEERGAADEFEECDNCGRTW